MALGDHTHMGSGFLGGGTMDGEQGVIVPLHLCNRQKGGALKYGTVLGWGSPEAGALAATG